MRTSKVVGRSSGQRISRLPSRPQRSRPASAYSPGAYRCPSASMSSPRPWLPTKALLRSSAPEQRLECVRQPDVVAVHERDVARPGVAVAKAFVARPRRAAVLDSNGAETRVLRGESRKRSRRCRRSSRRPRRRIPSAARSARGRSRASPGGSGPPGRRARRRRSADSVTREPARLSPIRAPLRMQARAHPIPPERFAGDVRCGRQEHRRGGQRSRTNPQHRVRVSAHEIRRPVLRRSACRQPGTHTP